MSSGILVECIFVFIYDQGWWMKIVFRCCLFLCNFLQPLVWQACQAQQVRQVHPYTPSNCLDRWWHHCLPSRCSIGIFELFTQVCVLFGIHNKDEFNVEWYFITIINLVSSEGVCLPSPTKSGPLLYSGVTVSQHHAFHRLQSTCQFRPFVPKSYFFHSSL